MLQPGENLDRTIDRISTDPPRRNKLERFSIYRRTPGLSKTEFTNTIKGVNRAFRSIAFDATQVEEVFFESYEDINGDIVSFDSEVDIAQEVMDTKKSIHVCQSALTDNPKLLDMLFVRAKIALLEAKDFNQFRRTIRGKCDPDAKNTNGFNDILAFIWLNKNRIDLDMSGPAWFSLTLQDYQMQLTKLEEIKFSFFTYILAKHLEENEPLKEIIEKLAIKIQHQRRLEGKPLHGPDFLIALAYEMVYDHYLFRNKTRKSDPSKSYFDEHLQAAASNHAKYSFTDSADIFSAFKHDSIEDVGVHDKNSPNLNLDWVCCYPLYADKLSDDYNDEYSCSPREFFQGVSHDVERRVLGMTKKQDFPTPDRDEVNLLAFFEKGILDPEIFVCKVLEQIQNFETLDGLSSERAREKMRSLRDYSILAKMLGLTEVYNMLVGLAFDFYEEENKTSIRKKFYKKQRKDIEDRLRLNQHFDSIPAHLFEVKILKRMLSFMDRDKYRPDAGSLCGQMLHSFNLPKGEVWDAIGDIRGEIMSVFTPIDPGIRSIDIIPSALESHIDLSRLGDPKYVPEIPEDPLFEIAVLVGSPDDLSSVAAKIQNAISAGHKMTTYPEDDELHGIKLDLSDPLTGRSIRVRVNTVRNETAAKKGIAGSIPEELIEKLKHAIDEARATNRPILEVIETEVLRPNMRIFLKHGAEELLESPIVVPQGATPLDVIAAAFNDRAFPKYLFQASHAVVLHRVVVDGYIELKKKRVHLFEPLEDEDICQIVIDPSKTNSTFGLDLLTHCADRRRFATRVRQYFTDLIQQKTPLPEDMDKARAAICISYAKRYIEYVLAPVLGLEKKHGIIELKCIDHLLNPEEVPQDIIEIDQRFSELQEYSELAKREEDPSALASIQRVVADMTTQMIHRRDVERHTAYYKDRRQRTMECIGDGRLDPLHAIDMYLDRERPISVSFQLTNRRGAFEELTGFLAKHGANIDPLIMQTALAKPGNVFPLVLEFPDDMSSYQILSVILKSHRLPAVEVVQMAPNSFLLDHPDSEKITDLFPTTSGLDILSRRLGMKPPD